MRCADCQFATKKKLTVINPPNEDLFKCNNEHFKLGYGISPEDIQSGDALVEDDEGWGFYVTRDSRLSC